MHIYIYTYIHQTYIYCRTLTYIVHTPSNCSKSDEAGESPGGGNGGSIAKPGRPQRENKRFFVLEPYANQTRACCFLTQDPTSASTNALFLMFFLINRYVRIVCTYSLCLFKI